jgi:hypothetical protein
VTADNQQWRSDSETELGRLADEAAARLAELEAML